MLEQTKGETPMNYKKRQTYFLWTVNILVMLSMVSLIMLSFYDHPSADDYSYARLTGTAWRTTRNLFAVLGAAVETAIQEWYSWQGPFTSGFFMSLQPALFGEQYYRITGILFVGLITICNLIFFDYILHKRLKCDRLPSMTIGMVASFLMLHYMPLASEGIYWFCGAVHYTLFFAATEILLCLLISLLKPQSRKADVIFVILASVLGFFLSGGNQMAAFSALLLTFGICVFCMVLKKKSYVIKTGIIFVFQVAGFLLSAFSPGSQRRSTSIGADLGIVGSIAASIQCGLEKINEWMGLEIIICVAILLPVIYDMSKKVKEQTGFQFKLPLLVFAESVGYLCALFCPTFYALGVEGPKRLLNGIYFIFIILLFLNVFYLCGWIQSKIHFDKKMGYSISWILFSLVLIFGGFLGNRKDTNGYLAYKSVSSGEAGLYSQQADARYNYLLNCEGQDVVVDRYDVYPYLLYVEEVTGDSNYFINQMVRSYFNLNSIVIK